MAEINGMFLVLGVAAVSILLCFGMWLVHSRKNSRSNAQDERYDRIMLHNILPSDQGVSIDEVVANLENEDMSGFHLSRQNDKGGSAS